MWGDGIAGGTASQASGGPGSPGPGVDRGPVEAAAVGDLGLGQGPAVQAPGHEPGQRLGGGRLVQDPAAGPPDIGPEPGSGRRAAWTAAVSPTGSTLVDPSDSRTPVPAAATCMTALAWSAAGCSMLW